MFVDPVTSTAIYNDEYYAGSGADPYVNYAAEFENGHSSHRRVELDDLLRLVNQRGAVTGSEARWLDFGCGAGSLLRFLAGRSYAGEGGPVPFSVEGHDVGTYAERLAQAGYTIRTWEELEALPGSSYDFISMVEVLEHIPFPNEIMPLIARLLTPGGLLILTTGNVSSIAAKMSGLNYRYLIPEIHVSLYTPKTLGFLYGRYGLMPAQVDYDGVVRFKIFRSLLSPAAKKFGALICRSRLAAYFADRLYGVSAMPWGRKQLSEGSPKIPLADQKSGAANPARA